MVLDTKLVGRRPGTMHELTRDVGAPSDFGTDVMRVEEGESLHLDIRLESVLEGVLVTGSVTGTATGHRKRKPFLLDLYSTSLGKKYVMALTGIAMMGYVAAHAIGNLKMYLGPEDINHYGEFLRELLVPILPRTVTLWLLRIGLLVAFQKVFQLGG